MSSNNAGRKTAAGHTRSMPQQVIVPSVTLKGSQLGHLMCVEHLHRAILQKMTQQWIYGHCKLPQTDML